MFCLCSVLLIWGFITDVYSDKIMGIKMRARRYVDGQRLLRFVWSVAVWWISILFYCFLLNTTVENVKYRINHLNVVKLFAWSWGLKQKRVSKLPFKAAPCDETGGAVFMVKNSWAWEEDHAGLAKSWRDRGGVHFPEVLSLLSDGISDSF